MKKVSLIIFSIFFFQGISQAQVEYRWLAAGSFHNFYSSLGSEIEEGFIDRQQAGWQWPAIYQAQDAQAMKALWLGAENFTDENGNSFSKRVVHVGPRVNGLGEFFPVEIKTISKFSPPEVVVDGLQSFEKDPSNDEVDPNMLADRKIISTVNTLLGVTVQRTAMQFSQQFHDNYHVIEYVFTNTGNTDGDEEIELPNQTVEGFIPYFLNRMSPVRVIRHTTGNGAGWGMNTMNDRRGDGLKPGEPETFRAQFAWHGLGSFVSSSNVVYDNIGGPVLSPDPSDVFLSSNDTTGRLAAYHFVGTVTLHADASATDDTDDPNQPFTMSEEGSDDNLMTNNDAFNQAKMTNEYTAMSKGRGTERHAFRVESSGLPGFLEPSGDPAIGTSGGYSYTYGYGPYTLAPGESVKIVIAEGSAGISRDVAAGVGRGFKEIIDANPSNPDVYQDITYEVNGQDLSMSKNEWVFTGRDSLFQTFERAVENYNAGFTIPEGPEPPALFFVESQGGGIKIEWEYQGDIGEIEGFDIYRAQGRTDSTYRLLYEASPAEKSISDGEAGRMEAPGNFLLEVPIRGLEYYYYIVSKGAVNNDNTGQTPIGKNLISNRYYTQTYDPATLLRAPGEAMSDIRVVPNPYSAGANSDLLFTDEADGNDRIYFYEIPGRCTINIYTEMGEKIKTILHNDGSGDEPWDLKTDSRQRIASGVYIARIVNEDPNDDDFGKVAIRKIVIIL